MLDLDLYIRFALALVVVLGLILLAGRVLRRLQGVGTIATETRLSLLEVKPLDPRRRLVRVGYGDQELLLLIGGDRDLLLLTSPRVESATQPEPSP
jgi:flagellar protein FliO/FliZ